MWQRCVFSMNWENPQKYVGFSSLFTLRLDFLPDSVVFQLSLFCSTFFSWGRMSAEILFGFPPCVLCKWCFPRCSLCRCPFYCMSVQCFTGNLSICDSGFWRRRSYSIWQLSVWDVCFLLAIFQQAFWEELFMQSRWASGKDLCCHSLIILYYYYFFNC